MTNAFGRSDIVPVNRVGFDVWVVLELVALAVEQNCQSSSINNNFELIILLCDVTYRFFMSIANCCPINNIHFFPLPLLSGNAANP